MPRCGQLTSQGLEVNLLQIHQYVQLSVSTFRGQDVPCCFHSVQFPVPRSSEWCAQQALAKSLRNMTRNCLPTFQPLSSHVRHRQFTKLRAVSSKHFFVQTHFHPTHFASMFFAPKRSIQITFSQNLFPKCTSKPFSPKTTIPPAAFGPAGEGPGTSNTTKIPRDDP